MASSSLAHSRRYSETSAPEPSGLCGHQNTVRSRLGPAGRARLLFLVWPHLPGERRASAAAESDEGGAALAWGSRGGGHLCGLGVRAELEEGWGTDAHAQVGFSISLLQHTHTHHLHS